MSEQIIEVIEDREYMKALSDWMEVVFNLDTPPTEWWCPIDKITLSDKGFENLLNNGIIKIRWSTKEIRFVVTDVVTMMSLLYTGCERPWE